MTSNWKEGQLYTFKKHMITYFYCINWKKADYRIYSQPFMLLVQPSPENIPEHLPSNWGNFGKVLLANGEVCWVRLYDNECETITP